MKRFVEVHYYIKDGKRDEFYNANGMDSNSVPATSLLRLST